MNNIIISQNIASDLNSYLGKQKFSQLVILVDENTERFCYSQIKKNLPAHHLIVIKSGEEEKTLDTCTFIWDKMTEYQLDRHSLMINLGGGVIGDMGGFCAATYKRGIRFIQIPSTLLAQVDASIGGKLGVDFRGFKNHIGVFKDPEAVFIYTPFTETLSPFETRSGFAEIIKHCLIADREMWEKIIKKTWPDHDLDELVVHSIGVKSKVVEEDPFEKGIRKALNFGHTIGHAIESYYLELPGKRLLHGEAIAIGMICESFVSKELNLISPEDLEGITHFINGVFQKDRIETGAFNGIINLTIQDKKNKNKKVLSVLLDGIGNIKLDVELTGEMISKALTYYNSTVLL